MMFTVTLINFIRLKFFLYSRNEETVKINLILHLDYHVMHFRLHIRIRQLYIKNIGNFINLNNFANLLD